MTLRKLSPTCLPTLAEQRAAGLETTLTLAILAALRRTGQALKAGRISAPVRTKRKR